MPALNPILQRELKQAARDPKVVLLVLAFLAILSAILFLLWPRTGIYSQASSGSLQVFGIFLMSNLALVILLVPALCSPSITAERENNSYALLFTSLLTPGAILRGKLLSATAMVLLVVLVALPVSALCALSGGISANLLLRAFTVIVVSALTYGMLSLAVSALCRTTFTALILSYALVAGAAGCTWLPYHLIQVRALRPVGLFIRCLSPFDALWSILYPQRYALTQVKIFTANPAFFFHLFLAGNLALLVACFVVFCRHVVSAPRPGAVYRWLAGIALGLLIAGGAGVALFAYQVATVKQFMFRATGVDVLDPRLLVLLGVLLNLMLLTAFIKLVKRARQASAQYQGQFTDLRTTLKRKLKWPFYLIDPLRRKQPIGRFRNPVFVAEMRSKLFARPAFIIYGLVACMGVSMLLLILACLQFSDWLSPDRVRLTAIVFQVGIIAVLAPAISSGAITDELTSRTFLMLRMTPIPATRVVLGKLKAAFVYVSIFLVSSLPVLFSLAFLDYTTELSASSLWRVGAWLAILVVVTVTFITAGLCCSAFSRSTSMATAVSYCFAALVCIVTLAALIPDAMGPRLQRLLLTLNPVVAALRVTSDDMFGQLPDGVWLQNLAALGSLAVVFVVASSLRVYYIFTHRS